eukprot:scaffold14022_cov42-Phaeocystis_antarctica.AAC.1
MICGWSACRKGVCGGEGAPAATPSPNPNPNPGGAPAACTRPWHRPKLPRTTCPGPRSTVVRGRGRGRVRVRVRVRVRIDAIGPCGWWAPCAPGATVTLALTLTLTLTLAPCAACAQLS